MLMPDRCQKRLVSSFRGLAQPRRPTSVKIAGSSVIDDRNATAIVTASAGPVVENTLRLVKLMPRNVTATVAADAAITLPMAVSARATASSESSPCRRYSW
ncbi:hypothetical protein MAUB1S_00995 [Mycolicibacterium aubagnense]